MNDIQPLHLRFEDFELDAQQARLSLDGHPVSVPPKAFDLLCALARVPGELISKGALLDAVWGHRHVSDSALKSTISELRAALKDHAREPRFIQTVARRGYRFIGATQTRAVPAIEPGVTEGTIARLAPSHLIRRDSESRRLHTAWADADAGHRRIVWVTGEAGIGKTTLIDRFVDALQPAVFASGQCVEQHGAGEPYLPVLSALSTLCHQDPALVNLLRAVAPTWLQQLPWLDSGPGTEFSRDVLKGTTQLRMLREFGELLEHYAHERPILLVTEDLHWSDRGTLTLIDHVARRRGHARLLWIASFRLTEVIASDHPVNTLRHELRLHRLAEELLIEPFSEQEVAHYLTARLRDVVVSDSFVRSVHERTDGLPLFVANLVDEIVDAAANNDVTADTLVVETGDAAHIPESLAGVIEAQLGRLAPSDRTLLDAASVYGVNFAVGPIASALKLDASQLTDRFDALATRRQWLDASDIERLPGGSFQARYAFRHALYRQVLYTRCSPAYRARTHGRIAAALRVAREAGHAVTAGELALHFELSQDLPTAITYYVEAAEYALHAFAPTEALAVTEHAMQLLPQCETHRDLLDLEIQLLEPHCVAVTQVHGLVCARTRKPFERLSALAELIPRRASSQLDVGFGWALCAGGEFERAREEAQLKLASAERHGNAVRYAAACNLYGKTIGQLGHVGEACRWLQRGIDAMAEADHEPQGRSIVVDLGVLLHAHLGVFLAYSGAVDRARQAIAIAHSRVDELGHPYSRYRVINFECAIETQLGRPDRVLVLAEAMRLIADEHAIGQADGLGRAAAGWAYSRLGDPRRGYDLLMEGHALELKRECLLDGSAMLGRAAAALAIAGQQSEASRTLDAAFAASEQIDERLHRPELLMIRAQIAGAMGNTGGQREALRDVLRESRLQESLLTEVAAIETLCAMSDASEIDFELLTASRARLTEGLDMKESLPVFLDTLTKRRMSVGDI